MLGCRNDWTRSATNEEKEPYRVYKNCRPYNSSLQLFATKTKNLCRFLIRDKFENAVISKWQAPQYYVTKSSAKSTLVMV